jgi:hypothetical protein
MPRAAGPGKTPNPIEAASPDWDRDGAVRKAIGDHCWHHFKARSRRVFNRAFALKKIF